MPKVNEAKKATPTAASLRDTEPFANTFAGEVVSLSGGKLVMKNKSGKQYTHTLANDVKFTCNGTACKAADLKPGRKIRVTTLKDDRRVATCIEAIDQCAELAECCG